MKDKLLKPLVITLFFSMVGLFVYYKIKAYEPDEELEKVESLSRYLKSNAIKNRIADSIALKRKEDSISYMEMYMSSSKSKLLIDERDKPAVDEQYFSSSKSSIVVNQAEFHKQDPYMSSSKSIIAVDKNDSTSLFKLVEEQRISDSMMSIERFRASSSKSAVLMENHVNSDIKFFFRGVNFGKISKDQRKEKVKIKPGK